LAGKAGYSGLRGALHTIVAVMLAWSFEAFDFMLFPMLAVPIMAELGFEKVGFGALISFGLLGTMFGGVVSGMLADRVGRRLVLFLSLLVYGLGTLIIAYAWGFEAMVAGRFIVGFGLGAEWSTGMTLISEVVEPRLRGRAVGIAQSGWPLGVLLAIFVVTYFYPVIGWRGCFLIALLPVLLVVYIGLKVPESGVWRSSRGSGLTLVEILRGRLARRTLLALAMNVFAMFSYWMFWSWVPTYLYEVRGLSVVKSAEWLISAQVGAFLGYLVYGFLQDMVGRRAVWSVFTATEAATILLYVWLPLSPPEAVAVGGLLGFFTGYWSGFGALLSELFPTRVRSTALGFVFNVGRAINFVSPIVVAYLSQVYGWSAALALAAVAAFAASMMIWAFPETKGRELTQIE